jgi:hypothetical protein
MATSRCDRRAQPVRPAAAAPVLHGTRSWAVVVPWDVYLAERLFLHDTLRVANPRGGQPTPGSSAALVACCRIPLVFALGRITGQPAQTPDSRPDDLEVEYTVRLFDAPLRASGLSGTGTGVFQLGERARRALVEQMRTGGQAPPATREWLVELNLPIEAASPAEAVRAFWTYAIELGPRELPAFVSPVGDELSMRAYVAGVPTDLDPEAVRG